MNDHDYFLEAAAPAKESSCVEVIHVSSTPKFKMETRKNRTPSARMLASKIEEGTEKPASLTPVSSKPPTTVISQSNLAIQLSKAANLTPVPIRSIPVPSSMTATPLRPAEKEHTPGDEDIDISVHEMEESTTTKNNTRTTPMTPILLKEGKIGPVVLNGSFPVSNEVTGSPMKYGGRPAQRKSESYQQQPRHNTFTGETLNLKNSDLSVPNKAAHFLYFRCYEEGEVQKEFPLTIDENRKGPQNFLVEPRVGLKNTDYYIDSYLWNRGKSTSSKKKIFVEIDGNHVKTSRRSVETAHYLLNWYYSNMESRICKKVCWLETVSDGVRASPVLVQYHVNYLSDLPIELRKTPKLYSDTRTVAQELLRSDSPLQTVQRFVETGETDPREIINKKQAYEMRRYVLSNARKKHRKRTFEEAGIFYDDDMFEEVYYDDSAEPPSTGRLREQTEAHRIAHMACRFVGRKIENRIITLLDNRLGPQKHQAELLTEWINTLAGTTADDYDIAIHNVVASMRKQLDEIIGADASEYLEEPGTSGKRRHLDVNDSASKQARFEGERFIFEGEEYVEEEVIAEDVVEDVPSTSENGEPRNEVKYDRADGTSFFFTQRGPAPTTTTVVEEDDH